MRVRVANQMTFLTANAARKRDGMPKSSELYKNNALVFTGRRVGVVDATNLVTHTHTTHTTHTYRNERKEHPSKH